MKKIFIVDNDPIFLKLITKFLKNKGHQVKTAIDGLNALDVLKNYTPDVMFVDLVMPNIDGETLCRIIRGMEKFKDAYLIILSAISAEEYVDIASFGANACIAKGPFNEMSQHILAALDQPASISSECLSGEVLGIDSVYPRGITKELLSAKRHFEVILEKMSDGVFEINAEGRIVYANPATLSLTNMPLENMLGLHFVDLFSGDDRNRISDLMKMAGVKTITDESPACLNRSQVTLNILPLDEPETSAIIILHDVTRRKQAEDALESAREHAQNIIDSSLDMIISVNNDRRIVEFNKAAETVFGYRKEEVVGKIVDILYADIAEGRKLRDKALKNEGYIGEIRNIDKDGNIFSALLSIAFMRDKEGEVIGSVGVSRDITEQKKILTELEKHREHLEEMVDERTKALQESEEKYRNLFENGSDLLCIHDLEGNLLDTNLAYKEQYGWIKEDLVGINLRSLIPDKHKSEFDQYLERIIQNGENEGYLQGLTKTGGKVIFEYRNRLIYDSKGRPKAVQGAARDVSERIASEVALKESEFKFRSLFDLSPQAIALTDAETGRLIDVNDKLCELTKYSKEELLGLTTTEIGFYSKEERNRFTKELQVSGEVQGLEMDFKSKDGSTLNTLMFAKIIQIEGEKYILTIFVDVTDIIRLETRLAQAHKMEAIGTLAGGIAHDFNNILSPIILHTEMMLEDTPEESPLHFNLEEVYSASIRARDLTKQILTFSRQDEQERVPLIISPIVKEALKLLRSSLPSFIEIRQNIEAEAGVVLTDPTQIHQIMLNLCTNAAYAMREKGGILEVSLIDVDLQSADSAHIPDLAPGQYVKLTVSDTGSGMGSSAKERIFDPYFTTKEKGEGTGLGLSVVHGIVKSYNGAILVDSEPGKGTVFQVFLPQIKGRISSKSANAIQYSTGTERVLLIDDERSMLTALQQMLERLGYRVDARSSGIEALDIFRKDPGEFDLIITDYTMPEVTGTDLAREAMGIRPDIPIILCTGFSEQINEEKSKALGIREFVMKPVVLIEMAETIRRVLDQA